MKKIVAFLKQLISINGEISSKRFLAFVFSVVLIIAIFTGIQVAVIYALSALITALLGITGIEKFAKNYGKSQDIG